MSETLRLMENEVQLAALAFMAVVYILRVVWLLRFRRTKERTFPEGSAAAGERLSLINIALPGAMESTRRQPFFYLQAEQLRATGTRQVVTMCHNCIDGLTDVIKHYRLGLKVVQILDLVVAALVDSGKGEADG